MLVSKVVGTVGHEARSGQHAACSSPAGKSMRSGSALKPLPGGVLTR
jgi:hypothetical protein